MIESLLSFAYNAAEWYEIGRAFTQSEHFDDLKKGNLLLGKGDETGDFDYYKQALIYLERINLDDKKAAQALAYYLKAYCYCLTKQFQNAYMALDDLDAIEISWHTMDKDIIREYQAKSMEARTEIKQIEKEYLKIINASNKANTNRGCLIFGLIALVLILIGLCVYLFFLSNV